MRYLPKTIRAQTLAAVSSIVIAVIVLLVWVTIYVTESHLYELGERDARDRVQAVVRGGVDLQYFGDATRF